MKRVYILELLMLLFSGSAGIVIWEINKWYWAILFGVIFFAFASYLIGELKKATLNEYIKKLKEQAEKEVRK